MINAYSFDDSEHGPQMIGPQNTHYGREVSRVETRGIDEAAMQHARKLLQQEDRSSLVYVLDLGCGTGDAAEKYARLGCHVTGADVRESHNDIAQRNIGLLKDGFAQIDFVNQDLYRLNIDVLGDKPWDVIILNRVLHFLPLTVVKNLMEQLVERAGPDTQFVINFRSSDHKTGNNKGRTYIESDEDGCLPTYYLHNAKDFITMLRELGCSITMHEQNDQLCLLFVKNSPELSCFGPTLPKGHPRLSKEKPANDRFIL